MSNVSIYVDYDNIYIMLEKFYQAQQVSNLSTKIIKEIRNKFKDVKILTFKAFCDFQKTSPVLTDLQKSQVELRHVYSSGEGEGRKNASDIALAIDVVKNLYNKNSCEKYVLVSSDSDMLPIINELLFHGKEVAVIFSEYGSKDDYKTYLDEWCVENYTIEEMLGIKPYVKITDEQIKKNIGEIIEIINNGVDYTFYKFAKESTFGTCSKKDILNSLKRTNKFIENDISIIIENLLKWNILCEHQSPYDAKYSIILLNTEFIKEQDLKLTKKVITISDYKA